MQGLRKLIGIRKVKHLPEKAQEDDNYIVEKLNMLLLWKTIYK